MYFVTIGIFIVVAARVSLSQNRNLCDLCECMPSAVEPSYINCNCKKNKPLILKDEDGDVLAHTKTLNISNCNFLSFPANGFPKSKKLKSIQIKQLPLFHLNSGIFPHALNNLYIEDVEDLIIDGFKGQTNLVTVEIKNSKVADLPHNCFTDSKNLEKLFFQNVSIANMAAESLAISSLTTRPWIKFFNSEIDTIHSDAISLHSSKFEIIDTSINVIGSNGISVTANDSIDLIRSTFGSDISHDSFRFRSNKMNIVDNEFKSIPSYLLKQVELKNDKKINFIGNVIHDIDLGGFILHSGLDKINFVKNKIICDCSPRKTSILKLKEVFPGLLNNDTYVDSIIENNSCKNYNGIHLSEFKKKFLSRAICNETDTTQLPSSYSPNQDGFLKSHNVTLTSETTTGDSYSVTFSFSILFVCVCTNVGLFLFF